MLLSSFQFQFVLIMTVVTAGEMPLNQCAARGNLAGLHTVP